MAFWSKLRGTTSQLFGVGFGKITLDTSVVGTAYNWKFPATAGTANYSLLTDGAGNLAWGVPTLTTVNGILRGDGTTITASATTGSGSVVLATTPTLVTPVIGAATGTSVVLTGSATAATFVPTSSTVPVVGMYLPATNNLAWSTSTTERFRITTSATLAIGTSLDNYRSVITGAAAKLVLSNQTKTVALLRGHSNTDVDASGVLALQRSASIAVDSLAQTSSLDRLGVISAEGVTTSSTIGGAAQISFRQQGDSGATHVPGRIDFLTSDGTNASTVRQQIMPDGAITMTSAAATATLTLTQSGSGNALEVRDVASDTTPFIIDALGNLVRGHTAPVETRITTTSFTAGLQTLGTSVAPASMLAARFNNDVSPPLIQLAKSRSTTIGGHAAVVANDTIGILSFTGSDGTAFTEAARISAIVDAGTTVATDSIYGSLLFQVNRGTTNASVEAARIDSAGRLSIGLTSGILRRLTLGSDSSTSEFLQVRTTSAGVSGVLFSDDPTGSLSQGAVMYDHSLDRMTLRAGSVATVVVSSTGATVTGTVDATTFSGSGASLTSLPAANLTGNVPIASLASGSGASSSTFLRGDNTWATPSGGGSAPLGLINQISIGNTGMF